MMMRNQLALLVAFACGAISKPLHHRSSQNSTSGNINWGPCAFNGTLPIECGSLAVPLDYTDSSAHETLSLALVKVPAINAPSRGSILFNFGGPGYEAIQSLASLGAYLQNVTGGYHDLVAFDPRGTGAALAYSCFESSLERTIATATYPFPVGDAYDTVIGQLWASSKVLANICHERAQNISGLIGTAFVARDLMQVVDAIEEDGLLRFWGFSYGSVLGETVAAMFPDRMDKIILDGVVNGHNYYHRTGIDVDQLSAADATFTAALGECIKAGDRCALSHLNSTAIDLQVTLLGLANDLKTAPITVNTTIIDYNFIMNTYYLSIKEAGLFQATAPLILDILNQQNLEAVVEFFQQAYSGIALGNPEALYGIKGGDTIPRYSKLEDVMPDIEHTKQTSPIFWGLTTAHNTLYAQWPFEAKERYTGDFKVKTRNPILFIGNTWDPATPLVSAHTMSAAFEGSVVLEQHGFGHASLGQQSACTSKAISDYFVNGILPPPNTLCEVESQLFP
ncbi:TAP-like protein-domain-containing protein [Truncatella angustata]|uniref:TAP-like protein-domain-containing protein n=1 Tax=Truncatella angustata TaxID=152316 RepID=A0A9P9A2T4_9PEZI|nr:TAP-like protein-domain-containing protein [Truncatella angustata]KAH6658265.1 TAP-like protein-domain-containing protein [Truncatella angustata]